MACQKYANKVRMMHESKGQRIGKAPSLHLFHTTVRQCMKATWYSYLIAKHKAHTPIWQMQCTCCQIICS